MSDILETQIYNIVYPSDFKIRIMSVKDEDGQDIPYGSSDFPTRIVFIVMDNYGGSYKAIYDTDETKCVNIHIENEGTSEVPEYHIHIIVENYKLKGKLKMKVGIAKNDAVFQDDKWDAWDIARDLPINIVI